jgi:hypothetical protein
LRYPFIVRSLARPRGIAQRNRYSAGITVGEASLIVRVSAAVRVCHADIGTLEIPISPAYNQI